MYRSHVLVCGGTGCTSSGSIQILKTLETEIKQAGLQDEVKVVQTGCFGLCALGPIVIVYPEGSFYSMVKEDDIKEIVEEHLLKGRIVQRLLYEETVDNDVIKSLNDTAFYKKQKRVALRNCGIIDPEDINEYIAEDGYAALGKCLTEYKPADVIKIIKDSGLRGRGGGGFPTGLKWDLAAGNDADQKYVCCNADEGDPGAFMDRSVLEGDPHALIEAMAIAGYAIGATQGYVYVRAEYPIAVKRLQIAIDQAKELGLLGKKIFGSKFDFDLDIRLGAGAFVCGEETALITSIEGNRGEPRPRPPYPAQKGLFGKPMGTTLREVIEDIGGGIPDGKKFKAAQTGGPSGGCIPEEHFDIEIDYDNLIAIGSMMGSGGLIVMDEDNCMVDIAKFFLDFTVDESCGKCTPCRIGTRRLYEMLEKVTDGKATLEDLDKIEELCYHIKENSLCGLGQTAPNPVLSTMRYFRDEYLSHVVDKKCPAGVCKSLLTYEIKADKCIGCTLCAKNCPANAITGQVKQAHVISKEKCVKCGVCIDKCKFNAIFKG